MKKSIFLSFASVAMILASCSSESFKIPYIPGNSEIEVTLSSSNSSLSTRAAIEGDGDIEGMGVFCVAKSTQGEEHDINWLSKTNEDPACLMDNVLSNKVGEDVVWADETAKYYYPAYQLYNYDFYGYYPYDEKAENTGDKITVNYKIDGEKDIIWGEAKSEADYAYSANYYRENDAPTDPKLQLNHMLTRLIFVLQQGEAKEGELPVPMTLDSVKVLSVADSCVLTVADRLNPVVEQRLAIVGETKSDIALVADTLSKSEEKAGCVAVEEFGNGKTFQLGSGIILCPQDSYKVRLVTTETKEGVGEEQNTAEFDVVLPEGSFEVGKAYKITILINGPRRITLKAALTPWEEVIVDKPIKL